MNKNDILSKECAVKLGYSSDRRKRRRQHRLAAKNLLRNGGFFNYHSARGTTFYEVVMWHLFQSRYI